jgi:hypothetical protein
LPGAPAQEIAAGAAKEAIVPAAPGEEVVAQASAQKVAAGAAVEPVAAGAPEEAVVARPAPPKVETSEKVALHGTSGVLTCRDRFGRASRSSG